MRSQARRDEKTLLISAALLVFAAILGVGGVVVLLAHLAVGVSEEMASYFFSALSVVAAALALVYLARRSRS